MIIHYVLHRGIFMQATSVGEGLQSQPRQECFHTPGETPRRMAATLLLQGPWGLVLAAPLWLSFLALLSKDLLIPYYQDLEFAQAHGKSDRQMSLDQVNLALSTLSILVLGNPGLLAHCQWGSLTGAPWVWEAASRGPVLLIMCWQKWRCLPLISALDISQVLKNSWINTIK